MQAHLDIRINQLDKHHNNIALYMQPYTATASDLFGLRHMLAPRLQNTEHNQELSRNPSRAARVMLTPTLPQFNNAKRAQNMPKTAKEISDQIGSTLVLRSDFA
jgi:hypothetical protein